MENNTTYCNCYSCQPRHELWGALSGFDFRIKENPLAVAKQEKKRCPIT